MTRPLAEQWEEAAAYCNMITETTGLERVLKDAVKRGIRRNPINHHIVVHPEYPWNPYALDRSVAFPSADQYREKFRTLLEEVFTEPHVLVWQSPGARNDIELPYDDEQVIPTIDPLLTNGSIQGLIDADVVEEALGKMGGIHPKDTYRISGAAMAHCTSQTAVQLFALTQWKIFVPPAEKGTIEERHRAVVREAIARVGEIQKKFRFDILHNSLFERQIAEFTQMLGKYATIIPHPEELH